MTLNAAMHPVRSMFCVLVLLLAFASSALADANQEARTTFEQGVEASRAQRWDDARMQFERSLSLVPKPSTMFNLALAYIKLGMGREALAQLDAFERAASPEEHAAMLERAKVLRPQAQALVDSAQAKAQSGGNVLARSGDDELSPEVREEVQRARDNYARGRDKEALDGFERAYEQSKRPELLYNIGVVADRLRNDERAIRAYDAFVKALPDAREAAVAQVRSEALRVALEREQSEQKVQLEKPAPVAPNLRPPRALIVTGSVLTVGGVAALAVLSHKLSEYHACLDSVHGAVDPTHICSNAHAVRQDKPAVVGGIAASAVLGGAGLVLLTVGAAQLYKRKHLDREPRLSLFPSFSLGAERSALLTARASF